MEPNRSRRWRWKAWLLRGYRAAVLGVIIWMIHTHHFELSRTLQRPVNLSEVQEFLPECYRLQLDPSSREGLQVLNFEGDQIGYALSTFPLCREQVGYCGPTEVLVVLDGPGSERILGISLRYSADTVSHANDVQADDYFMEQFNGLSWQEMADLDFKEHQVEGVSGATMTSMNMAYGIRDRFADSLNRPVPSKSIDWTWHDTGTCFVLLWGTVVAFARWRRNRAVQFSTSLLMILYFGFLNGDLLAQALLGGWAQNGVPWRLAPGLTLMVAASFLLPWATRRPVFCSHICPHGAAQHLLTRWSPWKFSIRADIRRGLLWLRPVLLVFVLCVLFLGLNRDLASIEPFDAYLLSKAGTVTIVVAVLGLLFSFFIPMGYCKYGCPTGAVLEFVRSHGRADHFHKKDVVALLFVILSWLLMHFYGHIQTWINS